MQRFSLYVKIYQITIARPQVDTRPPQTYMHLHLKLKKLQVGYTHAKYILFDRIVVCLCCNISFYSRQWKIQ